MLNRSSVSCSPFFLPPVSSQVLFFFSSRRRHTRSVSAFLLNRSSDLPIHPFQSPSSSSSDNDFSSPPTSPESPPPPTSALPLTLKPEVDTTWVGTMDTTLTDVSLMTPILSGYQLKPVPTNARKRRTTTNRKTVRGGRGRAGRGSVKSILASPPHLPPTPLSTALPISPSPAKLVKSDSESYPIIATPIEGGVPVEESQLRQLLHDHVLKEKRLKRKAELARLSRKKKQLRMSDLEKQNQALLEENQRLLQQNAMLLAERGKVVYKQEAKVIQKAPLQPTVSAPPTAKSKSLESHIHAINELFTKNGDLPAYQVPLDDSQVAQLIGGVSESFKQLTGSLESSLKQIGETLVPCTVMQFLEWTLMQREKFYQEEKDRKSGSAGMPRPISYAVFCLKKKKEPEMTLEAEKKGSKKRKSG
eukprot:TRINITY_DN966_c0_g1_i8.p1 TRINITY_DN966_c0_g1~~TRINITY_DN966_c0_g1_i8.p1  ORF type:complete len:418 (+),score=84.19 TRINITY_DN966_c0_g1_i8:2-1255(+)